jgi:hypothetical protein
MGEVGHGPLPDIVRSAVNHPVRQWFSLIARCKIYPSAYPLVKVDGECLRRIILRMEKTIRVGNNG